MEVAKASWNTVYKSREGFECQITLRDEDEASLAQRASKLSLLTQPGVLWAHPIMGGLYLIAG